MNTFPPETRWLISVADDRETKKPRLVVVKDTVENYCPVCGTTPCLFPPKETA